jgi:hypothetical protein
MNQSGARRYSSFRVHRSSLTLQLIRPVYVHRGVVVVKVKRNGQGHRRFGRCQYDHKHRDRLAVQADRIPRRNLLPKATKFTFAPLRTSSIPISTPSALRFVAMQTTPATNRIAPTTR